MTCWMWGWYGDRFIITEEDERGGMLRQIAMPREDAEKMLAGRETRRALIRGTPSRAGALSEGGACGQQRAPLSPERRLLGVRVTTQCGSRPKVARGGVDGLAEDGSERRRAVEAEREACARLCDDWIVEYPEDIFPPIPLEPDPNTPPPSSDRIGAAMARHVAQCLASAIRQRAGAPTEGRPTPDTQDRALEPVYIEAREIVTAWLRTQIDDFTQSCIADRAEPLIDAIAAALAQAPLYRV